MKSANRSSWLAALGIVAVSSAAACAYQARAELIDDAFIFFRYAANLVSGHGLVFNPGERVEGYTSLLWVLLLAGTTWAGIDPEIASRVAGGLFAVLTAAISIRILPEERNSRPLWSRLLAPLLLALNPVLSLWAVHGLETALFALCVAVALKSDLEADATKASWTLRQAFAWALATLARPEGFLLSIASAVHGLVRRPRLAFSRGAAVAVGSYAVIVVGHLVWRVAYYGSVLPNTFHAKVGLTTETLSRGLGYLGQFLFDPGALLFLLLVPAAGVAQRDPRIRYLFWMAVVYLAGVVLEGGDAFPAFRFVVPILPALYLLMQEGAHALAAGAIFRPKPERLRWVFLATFTVLAAALHLQQLNVAARLEREGANRFTGGMKQVGMALRERFPPDTVVALNPVGAIPYITGFRTVDMLGLTDSHIARTEPLDLGSGQAGHEKGDGRYVLSRRPDIILLGNVLALREVPIPLSAFRWPVMHRSERELARLPDLGRLYERDSMPIGGGLHLLFLRRKGFPGLADATTTSPPG
jgi:arabinofuranosyltransferase